MSVNYHKMSFNLFLVFCFFVVLNGDRIKSKIYKTIETKHFCFRRMNATNQIGCNSKEGGNVGILYLITNETDMTHVLKSGGHSPYIPVIETNRFNIEIMKRFKQSSDRISGLLIIDSNQQNQSSGISFLSTDKSCPNDNFDVYVNDKVYGHCHQQEWNSQIGLHNEGIMFEDWEFPILLIKNQNAINDIKECFSKYGGPDWPLCALQLETPMSGAMDSVTCVRRNAYSKNSFSLSQTMFCDPLGGNNIFSTLLETSKYDIIDNNSIIVLSARLDSFSMFDNISPGADSALTSVITLLSVADTLNKLKKEIKKSSKNRNVLFALFDGEAFDYIGSSRVLYDMNANKFPSDSESYLNWPQIRSQHFSHFIELNQLAKHNNSLDKHQLWIHKYDNTSQILELQKFIKSFAQNIPNLEINDIPSKRALPPSSLQTFLKNDRSLTGVVITNHEKLFSNRFYNSFYDDFSSLNKSDSKLSKTLTDISTVVSKTIYRLLTNENNDSISSNETLVEELLNCYMVSAACPLFQYVWPDSTNFQLEMEVLPTYVGVYRSSSLSSTSRYFTHLLLSYLNGEAVNKSKDECTHNTKSQEYNWMANQTESGICIRSQTIKLSAISPAFDNYESGHIPDSDIKIYSTWTESQWKSVSARLFIKPSPLQEWLTFFTGLIVLIISFIVVYILREKSSVLFSENIDIVPQHTLSVDC